MKRTIIKTIAVTALIFGFATTSVFAKSQSKNPYGHPQGQNSERRFDPRNEDFQMGMHGGMHFGMGGADLVGTISSVDTGKSLITIKDADGKETQVHINPFTRVVQCDNAMMKTPPKADRKSGDRPEITELKIEDLKKDSWVMVKKFNGETKTLEAARIVTIKE